MLRVTMVLASIMTLGLMVGTVVGLWPQIMQITPGFF